MLLALKQVLLPSDSVWSTTYVAWSRQYAAAALTTGVSVLDPTLYGCRHGGASRDRLLKRRTQEETQRRGRWASLTSLNRYEKATLLMGQVAKLGSGTLTFSQAVEQALPAIMSALADDIRRSVPSRLPASPPSGSRDRQVVAAMLAVAQHGSYRAVAAPLALQLPPTKR